MSLVVYIIIICAVIICPGSNKLKHVVDDVQTWKPLFIQAISKYNIQSFARKVKAIEEVQSSMLECFCIAGDRVSGWQSKEFLFLVKITCPSDQMIPRLHQSMIFIHNTCQHQILLKIERRSQLRGNGTTHRYEVSKAPRSF
jgi:hypothetical protein